MEDTNLADQLEATKIRDKLKETCSRNSRTRYGKEKFRGPLIAKHNVLSPTSPRQAKRKPADNESPYLITSPSFARSSQPKVSPNTKSAHGIIRSRHRSPSFSRSRHTSPSSLPFQGLNSRHRTPSPGNIFDPHQVEIIQKRLNKVPHVRFYLLRQPGPNSFLITADSTENKFKVIIGPQTCTCGKGPHCLHLLFVMVRVLKVNECDSLIWSKTLKNYEVENLFHKYHHRRRYRVSKMNLKTPSEMEKLKGFVAEPCSSINSNHPFSPSVPADEEESLCPICLLEMTDEETLVICWNGCRNKLHHHCISIWAEECRRQNEPIICPLCRARWVTPPSNRNKTTDNCTTPQGKQNHILQGALQSPQVNITGPGPPHLETTSFIVDRHEPLPRAEPIPDCYLESAKPWIEVLGADMVACFYSRDWAVREKAIRRLTREVISVLFKANQFEDAQSTQLEHKTSYYERDVLLKCCSNILTLVANDPVYKVYTACLRCLRGLLAYSYCSTEHDVSMLQILVKPVLETIILRCADGNRRTSQLSIATILELCRGQNGALGVGCLTNMSSSKGLGGVSFVLNCCVKRSNLKDTSWQWLLGRFCLINRLVEEFTDEFALKYVTMSQAEFLQGSYGNEPKLKLLNNDRVSNLLKFSLEYVNNSHSTVSKMARRVFVQIARLCTSVPIAFTQVYEMLSTLDPNLQIQLKKKVVNEVKNFSDPYDGKNSTNLGSLKFECRRGSIGGDRETKLVHPTLGDKRENGDETRAFRRFQRSSSHSPRRALKKPLNFSQFNSPSKTPSNHVPRIITKTRQPASQKPLRRPTHLPLLHKTSSLLSGKPCPTKISPQKKQTPTNCCSCKLDDGSASILPHHMKGCQVDDLSDLSPSSPDTGWSASFQNQVPSPNTPSIVPVLNMCSVKNPDETDITKKLSQTTIISTHVDLTQQGFPVIPGLSKDDPAFIIHIQPEMEVDSFDDVANKGTYQQDLHWSKGPLLGTGAFSTCFQARDIKSGTLMAVKQASFCRNSEEEQEKVMESTKEEITLMAKLDHHNVVRILGSTQQGEHFNMFFEWMSGGSVASLLDKYGPFTESVVCNYTAQVLEGLAYLHNNQILHRDLKGANLLVDSTGRHLRIGDFGAAARLASQTTVTGEFQGQLLGTIAFMAPEVLRGEDYGRSCDIWSVGCVIIEMVTSKPPWNANDLSNHLALIFKIACSVKPPPVPDHISPELKDLIYLCLKLKSEERPSANKLSKYKCLTDCL